MRIVVGVLMLVSIVAGIVISLYPIGPCNHSLWQWVCVFPLYPALAVASLFWDANTWGFQRCAFLFGLGQAGVLWVMYMMAVALLNRTGRRNLH